MRARHTVIDADNHYYEPDDAFTRHIEPAFRDRAIHIVRAPDGSGAPYFGEVPLYALSSTPVDRMGKPGAWVHDKEGRYQALPEDDLLSPGEVPHFAGRAARLAWMDDAGVQATLLWPSLGLVVENQLRDEPDACVANFRSFNRWIDEEWGFHHQDRIFGVPWLTLIDLDEALTELDYVLEHGARAVGVLFAPVGGRALGEPYFDPFWARLAEAGVPIAFHGAESGYNQLLSVHWGERGRPPSNAQSAFQRACFFGDRPIMDALASLVLHNTFGRHPQLRCISVENGASWVPYLLGVLDKAAKGGAFGEWRGGKVEDLPSEVFKHHVSVAPFDDDDIRGLVDLLGVERVLLGSDYPHPEGYPDPVTMLDGAGLTDDEVEQIAHVNGALLLGLS